MSLMSGRVRRSPRRLWAQFHPRNVCCRFLRHVLRNTPLSTQILREENKGLQIKVVEKFFTLEELKP